MDKDDTRDMADKATVVAVIDHVLAVDISVVDDVVNVVVCSSTNT